MPPSNGVSDELLAARKLAPEITRRADEFERERVVAPEIVSAMVEAGLVEMAIPKAYGGSESHLLDIIDVIEAISYADASTGWCLMNYQTTAYAAALMEPSGARMVFDGAERAVPAGVLAPTGRARRVKDGLVVSGRWAFASGSLRNKGCPAMMVQGNPAICWHAWFLPGGGSVSLLPCKTRGCACQSMSMTSL